MSSSKVRHVSRIHGPTWVNYCVVSHVVRPECLGLLLHFTVIQDIQHRLNPGLSPSSDFTLDAAGAQRLRKITNLTFASGKISPLYSFTKHAKMVQVGSICNCGKLSSRSTVTYILLNGTIRDRVHSKSRDHSINHASTHKELRAIQEPGMERRRKHRDTHKIICAGGYGLTSLRKIT